MIFTDYPGHFIAVLLLAATAGLIILVFNSRRLREAKLTVVISGLLMGLRYAAIVILLLILWNPSRFVMVDKAVRNSVLAFFDTSQSMSIVEDAGITRLDRAIGVFDDIFRPSSAEGPQYSILGFDSQVYHSGSPNLLKRWGRRTDMHRVSSYLGASKAKGAVIFTDGQANDQDIDTYLPFAQKDFPVVIVGAGSKKPQRDVAIKSLSVPGRVAIDSVYKVKAVVTAENIGDEPITVELLKDGHVIDSNDITAGHFAQSGVGKNNETAVEFSVAADSLGSHNLLVRAHSDKKDANPANNVRSAMVEVVQSDELKVLLYSQTANFNIGKLRQVLAKDSRIHLDLCLDAIRSAGLSAEASKNCGYVKLPETREEFFEYDIIVLGPCRLDDLTDAQTEGLYSFVVERGGGLMLLAGRDDFGPIAWSNQRARSLIPVVFDADESKLLPPGPGVLELGTEAARNNIIIDNADIIDNDVQVSAYYRIAKVKPAANMVATIAGVPAVSMQRIGRGRVCLLNISQLFPLYREDKQGGLLFKLISGLTSCLGRTPNPAAAVELFAERPSTEEDKVKFSAYVCHPDKPVGIERANVLLNVKDKVLTMSPAGQGYYTAEIDNAEMDTILATAQAEFEGLFLGEKTIAVNLPPLRNEMTDVRLNEPFMQALADRLGGKYVHAEDIDKNVAKIFDAKTHQGTTQQITSVWPKWPLFAALCCMLSIEWFIRRAKGLV